VCENLTDLQFGSKLKIARKLKGLKLKELAESVGCSESFLSKIENDKVQPSLQTLHAIVSALDTSISELFSTSTTEKKNIMRASERPHLTTKGPHGRGSGLIIENLVPASTLSLIYGAIFVLEPGGTSAGSITHQGEEIGYVLKGEFEITIDQETYHLKEGDSFFFESHLPHSWKNIGTEVVKIIWFNSPSTF